MIQHIKTAALVVMIVGVSLTKSYAHSEFCSDAELAERIAQTPIVEIQDTQIQDPMSSS